ncbi:MAG: glycosyltransferase [Nostoc sp.]|uniref:glycosyltransferase n=1 Tax=unclassified Nostoc TaxID=2593658 RepID=UPI001DBED4D4|nr:glycosyltransferase [Nostoc sp. JL34]MBN3887240.1 glycosyltransferase family 1 protein [Nostoc sp. JL34]
MSTIVITTYGTLGDHLPFIALGKVLKTRGHQVRMVVNQAIHPYVLKAGLQVADVGRPQIGPQEAQRYAREWNHLPLLREESLETTKSVSAFDHNLIDSVDCVMEACHDADLLISCSLQKRVAAMTADIYDICWVESCVTPFFLCFPKSETENQASSGDSLQNTKDLNRLILAASPYLCELLPEYSHAHQTGFWFYEDPDWIDWQPSQELKEFVEQEPKPLVLSYSSVPVENPQEVVEIHVRAAAKLGRRIVIQQGWAGFNESHLPLDIERDNVMFLDGLISHNWLFSRAAALITHGGVGTIARSLCNGCPMLVEPLGNDQFYNALQVLRLGVGSVMDSQKLTVDGIANILQKKILTPDYKKRAVEVGEKIKAEQGLIEACDLIESWL